MGRDALIKALNEWIRALRPVTVTDYQQGYLAALKEVKGKLLGAE